jgi:hypothetical protein
MFASGELSSGISQCKLSATRPKVKVFCAVLKDKSVWPFLLCGSYCHRYDIPRYAVTIVVDPVKGRFSEESPFQQDRAPPNFRTDVRYFLKENPLEA